VGYSKNKGNVRFDGYIDRDCVSIGDKDIQQHVKQVLPFLGLNKSTSTLNFISMPYTLSRPDA
jgi:hypothetical protein